MIIVVGALAGMTTRTGQYLSCAWIEDVFADPQAHAAGGFVEVPDGESTTLLPATPVDFDRTP